MQRAAPHLLEEQVCAPQNGEVVAPPLRLAFVGCGRVVEGLHLPALRQVPSIQVVGLHDVDADRCSQVARRENIERTYATFDDLLADAAIEAVAVCVPVREHAAAAERVLQAGRHLFVEKPLALTLPECDRLVMLAAAARTQAAVGFHMRWLDLVTAMRNRLPQVGTVEQIQTAFTSGDYFHDSPPAWLRSRELGGGVWIEEGIHHFDLWRALGGADVSEVSAFGVSRDWDDLLGVISGRLANGALVSTVLSNATGDTNELAVYGPRGRLSVSCYRLDGLEFIPYGSSSASASVRLQSLAFALGRLPARWRQSRQGGAHLAPYVRQWTAFANGIRNGRMPCASLEDGRAALRVSLAAVRSAEEGRTVRLADVP